MTTHTILPGRSRTELPPEPPPDLERPRKRMLLALGMLLVALVAVVVKDWDFWFPSAEQSAGMTAPVPKRPTATTNSASASSPAAITRAGRQSNPVKRAEPAKVVLPLAAVTQRTALPPLQVEVVAGNRRTTVPANSPAIQVDVGAANASSAPAASSPVQRNVVVNATERVQLSPETKQSVSHPVPPDYPLLARQMKVQGAVVLEALVSREGTIQQLQILSGPDILAAAAREAVKQWRFKPYYLNGQAVETQARITVNFTISTN